VPARASSTASSPPFLRLLVAALAPSVVLVAIASCVDQDVRDCGNMTCSADTLCIHPAPSCPICVLRVAGGCPAGSTPANGDPICVYTPEGCVQRPLAPIPYCADTVPVGCLPACSVATCGANVDCLPPSCR
jgi:hypothetical protein